MAGERLTFVWNDFYGDARPSKTTSDILKKWDTICEQDPSYSIYCTDFLSDVICALQEKYDYFCLDVVPAEKEKFIKELSITEKQQG